MQGFDQHTDRHVHEHCAFLFLSASYIKFIIIILQLTTEGLQPDPMLNKMFCTICLATPHPRVQNLVTHLSCDIVVS